MVIRAKDTDSDSLQFLSFEELLNLTVSYSNNQSLAINETPASVYIITQDEIELFGYRNLSEILENIPGYYKIDDLRPYKENIGIRGYTSGLRNGNITILINGVIQRQISESSNFLSTINLPVQAVERIEVIRGPMSVTYGTGAFLGAINIITSEKIPAEKTHVYSNAGTQNTLGAGMQIVRESNDFGFDLISDFKRTDGISQNFSDFGIDTSLSTDGFFKERSSFIGLKVRASDFSAYISYDSHINNLPSANVDLDQTYDSKATFGFFRSGIIYEKELTKKLKYFANLQYFAKTQSLVFDTEDKSNDHNESSTSAKRAIIDASFTYTPTKKIETVLGYTGKYIFDYRNLDDFPHRNYENVTSTLESPHNIQSIYAFTHYNFSKHIIFHGGIRLEQLFDYSLKRVYSPSNQYSSDSLDQLSYAIFEPQVDGGDLSIIPQIATIVKINENHLFKFLFGTAINRPGFEQEFATGNEALRNETINSYDLSYHGKFSDFIRISASAYHSEFNNLFVSEFELIEDDQLSILFKNRGVLQSTGLELDFHSVIHSKWFLNFAGTFQKTKNINHPDVALGSSPQILGYLKIAYKLPQISFALTGNYVSKMESRFDFNASNPFDVNSDPVGRTGAASDAYFLLGANVRISPNILPHMYFNLRASNILDSKFYYPGDAVQPWATNGILGLSRTLWLTIGHNLN